MILKFLFSLLLPVFLFPGAFKVASYNVENLFDDIKNGSEYESYIPGIHNWTSRMAEIKLNHTAEALCELDADIVGLQEIENQTVLSRLQKRLKRVGCPYPYASMTHKKSTTIQTALLSRYPISRERELQVNYSRRDRNILEAVVTVDGHKLIFFVNHWKSKSRNGAESRRVRYARVLRKRIEHLPKGSEYIILGDMNSHYDEYRTMSRHLNDTNGITGINHHLRTTVEGEMVLEKEMISGSTQSHYNLWMELPASKRWSHKFYGNKAAIDHIILPWTLFDGKGIDYVNNSFGVFKAPFLFQKKGYVNSWEYRSGKHTGKGYSDHLPIYAYFSTVPYRYEKAKPVIVETIKYLYGRERLDQPVQLQGCTVIFKRGDNAVIRQSPEGMAIYLYGAARGLEEGERVDMTVSEIKEYKGLKEITRIEHVKKRGIDDPEKYYYPQKMLNIDDPALQNQIFSNLAGIYRKGNLEIDGKKIPVYFKKRKLKPKEGSRLKIFYAHLGYYRKPQLVIYDRHDFEVEK